MTDVIESPYEVLELPLNASPEQVKKHYKMLIRKYPPEQKPDEFTRIRLAYDMLTTDFFIKKPIFPLYQAAILQQKSVIEQLKVPQPHELFELFETPFNTIYELEAIVETIPL